MRHGLADAEGIADREHDVADHQLVGIGEVERGEFLVRVLQPQHREIGARVLQDDFGFEFALVGQRYLDLVGALDDVHVGDDEPGRIDHHARAERALHLLALPARHAEETAKQRIVHEGVAVLHDLGGVDVDHRGLHTLHDRRVGQPQFLGGRRHAAVLRQRGCGERGGYEHHRDEAIQHHE